MSYNLSHKKLRKARKTLGLSVSEFAKLLEVDDSSVYKWERNPALVSSRPAPTRVSRLVSAYLSGWRPTDWPRTEERTT